MSYIDRNLLPDERILFRTKKHLILFAFPVLITILAAFSINYIQGNPLLAKIDWVPWLLVFVFWAHSGLEYITSDYAVTNKRVIMREGFFVRRATALRLSTISQVNIEQSLLGQVLNYGTVSINAFGAYDVYLLIARPFEFQKQVNQQL